MKKEVVKEILKVGKSIYGKKMKHRIADLEINEYEEKGKKGYKLDFYTTDVGGFIGNKGDKIRKFSKILSARLDVPIFVKFHDYEEGKWWERLLE